MIGYLILGVLLLAAVLLAMRWAAQADPVFLARMLRRVGLGVMALALLFLLVTGRVGLVGALVGLGLPIFLMFRRRGAARASHGGAGPSGPGRSSLATAWLEVSLDHATGAVDGTVKQGRFAGRPLGSLAVEELVALLAECRNADTESATILEAYLDRVHGSAWRQQGPGVAGGSDTGGRGAGMTREEAYAVLGLKPDAATAEVREAYHRLMKKLHPDQGGSDYLAARLNEARDRLLGS
jgi:hypothetical protein